MNPRHALVGLCAAFVIAGSAWADAVPTYTATTAWITWNFYGVGTEFYSFSGPEVNLSGAAYFDRTNYYFLGSLPLLYIFQPSIPPYGNSSGVISDVPLPNAVTFWDAAESSVSITFSATDLNPAIPGTLTGTLTTCDPNPCNQTGNGQFFHVGFDIPGQWTFTIVKSPYITEYYLASAQFTTVPEPGSGILLVLGIAGLCLHRYRQRSVIQAASVPKGAAADSAAEG